MGGSLKLGPERVVVVTGASSGIGRELAFQFAAKGCAVVLAARNAAKLQENAAEIVRRGGRALPVPTDVSQRAQVDALIRQTVGHFGRVDVLVNNAGISPARGTVMENSERDVRATFEVNFMGGLYGVWAAVPEMEKIGEGLIVFVTSIVGKRGIPRNAAYCASKFAEQGLAESLRGELRRKRIGVLTVCPPGVDTPFFLNNEKGDQRRYRLHPVDRIARDIIAACESGTRELLPTWDAKLLHYLNVIAPRFMDWAIARAKGA